MKTKLFDYCRSQLYSWYDLSVEQQRKVIDYFGEEVIDEDFVIYEDTPLPLSMFIKINKKSIWDGVYETSYFTGYFLKVASDFSEALIAYRYW